jgi:hypothetical protein
MVRLLGALAEQRKAGGTRGGRERQSLRNDGSALHFEMLWVDCCVPTAEEADTGFWGLKVWREVRVARQSHITHWQKCAARPWPIYVCYTNAAALMTTHDEQCGHPA